MAPVLFFWIVWNVSAQAGADPLKSVQESIEQQSAPEAASVAPSDEIVITGPRLITPWNQLPYRVFKADTIGVDSVTLVEDMGSAFDDEPAVTVQRTARGQSSPYLRGFTGFRTLTLIDGVRLNQAIFRDGPNQYFQLVDPWTLESARVVGGPGSVLYGSDAIGGTLLLESSLPRPAGSGLSYSGRLVARAASAEQSYALRAESEIASPDVALRFGATTREFDDFYAGQHEGLQRNTAYDSGSLDLAITVPLTDELELSGMFQRVNQVDVPRTHSTLFGSSWRGTSPGSDLRRDFDQLRELEWLKLDYLPQTDRALELILSRQRFREEEDRVRSSGLNAIQGFTDLSHGASFTWFEQTEFGKVSAGFDWTREAVDSDYVSYNEDGTLDEIRPRGPIADDSLYETIGLFVEDEFSFSGRTWLTAGARFTHVHVDAKDVDPDPTDPIDFGPIKENYSAVVGSLRASHRPDDVWTLYAGISQAFRAPNLADLTRFDASRSGEAEIPAPDLDPERFLTIETGASLSGDRWQGGGALWYTFVKGLIVRFPTGDIDSNGDSIVTKDNAGDGYSVGLEFFADYRFGEEWEFGGSLALVDGEVEQPIAPGVESDQPFSKLAPTRGELHVRYDPSWNPQLQFVARIRFADHQDDLSDADKRDTQRIPPDGTPGYSVFDLRANYWATDQLKLFFELENVTNRDYRIHGSGNNMPGINFVFGFDLAF